MNEDQKLLLECLKVAGQTIGSNYNEYTIMLLALKYQQFVLEGKLPEEENELEPEDTSAHIKAAGSGY